MANPAKIEEIVHAGTPCRDCGRKHQEKIEGYGFIEVGFYPVHLGPQILLCQKCAWQHLEQGHLKLRPRTKPKKKEIQTELL